MGTERERERHHERNASISINGEEDDSRRRLVIMAKLKDSTISELDPSLSVNSSVLERRLEELFHGFGFHTPTHPPYALMIRTAISGLNEEGGSTEEAISEFIKREYDDLPWAHRSVLGDQLRKLCDCQDGELARTEDGRYLLRDKNKKNKKTEKNNEGIEQEIVQDVAESGKVVEQVQGGHQQPHSKSVEEYGKVYRRQRSNAGSKPEPLHQQEAACVKFKEDMVAGLRSLEQNHK